MTQADADKMKELADRFDRRPYLAFATLKDVFSEGEKLAFESCRGMVTK
jgi:hypothetical protein